GEVTLNQFCGREPVSAVQTCSGREITLGEKARALVGERLLGGCDASEGELHFAAVSCGGEVALSWRPTGGETGEHTLSEFCSPLRPLKARSCAHRFTGISTVVDVSHRGEERFNSCEEGLHPSEPTWLEIGCG
ncbi:hypothetical protein COY95_02885, partial [Candidatus Woesearchaeota archaeon CG_4_10_14_0_8_um_filter_47_5]